MGIQLHLILAALCAANLFPFIRSIAFDKVDNEREVCFNNIQNLFDAIAKNDTQKSGTYRNILKQDGANEKRGFDTMKEELQIIQNRNIQKKKSVNEIIVPANKRKRRQNEHGRKTRLERLDGAIVSLKAKLKGLRTGRVTSSLLEPVTVDVYGAQMSINHLGTISTPEPNQIMVQVWDQSQIAAIVKAIQNAGLGFNPSSEGNVIRVPVPPLTEERRRELTKKASEYGENAKISIRILRREAIDALKRHGKEAEVSENVVRNQIERMKRFVDGYAKTVDDIVERKSKEIMTE